jgi:ABC-type multidrug transport system fused ATPase/permease subunit
MITIFYLPDNDQIKKEASNYAWYFFAIACGVLISTALQQYCFAVMGQELARRARRMLFAAILRQDIG